MMQDEDGLAHQISAELSLLSRAAGDGDVWAMCELARCYFHHGGDLFLPEALRMWRLAALQGDHGATEDLQALPIHNRILSYHSAGTYPDIEMKCALLTEWHLQHFGLSPWEKASREEQKERIIALLREASQVLEIPGTELSFVPHLSLNGMAVDGLAHWEGRISVREELLDDIERLIEVIFHELGHIVAFEIRRGGARGRMLQDLYGITDERVRSWEQNEMGDGLPTGEEDPDTLSYGVYTLWATFFI
jgi:hypothetical protein